MLPGISQSNVTCPPQESLNISKEHAASYMQVWQSIFNRATIDVHSHLPSSNILCPRKAAICELPFAPGDPRDHC